MTTDLAVRENQRPIVMKSGLIHWVSDATAERVQQALQEQNAHRFIQIAELKITINTAEVEGVYDMEQYQDLLRIKQGEYQCVYRTWHTKKDTCDCKRELLRKQKEEKVQREKESENTPLTDEQRARNVNTMKSIGDNLRSHGYLPPKLENNNE